MPIDIDKLLRFRIPDARQELDPRDIAAYALSVGMGRLDPRAVPLDYVDPARGPKLMPAMVLVLAHPGFWAADPASGIDPGAVLHLSQSFEILDELPSRGVVASRSKVLDVTDKGPGKAAIVTVGTDLWNGAGTRFARLKRGIYVRDGGGFGGTNAQASAPVALPSRPPDKVCDLTTGVDQALHYRLNGDLNPLHSDPAIAEKAGFERPILHGLCVLGVISHALLREQAGYRADALRSMSAQFRKPVYPGETIRTEIWNDGFFRARVPERDLIVVDKGLVDVRHAVESQAGMH